MSSVTEVSASEQGKTAIGVCTSGRHSPAILEEKMTENNTHGEDGEIPLRERDLLTVEQAANYLPISASSIRLSIRDGRVKAFRIAGLRKVLIPRTEVLALLEPAAIEIASSKP
jgi:excisionase family DNA binding protein